MYKAKYLIEKIKNFKIFLRFLLVTLLLIISINISSFPKIFYFAKPLESNNKIDLLIKTPIHLDDDPMITLRAGKGVIDYGYPSINKEQKAQPSTSYLLPYLSAFLLRIFSPNLSIWIFGIIIFTFGIVSIMLIPITSKNLLFSTLLSLFLLSTDTFRFFSLTGWDHIALSLPLAIASIATLKSNKYKSNFLPLLIGLLCSLAFLIRADSLIAISGIFLTYQLMENKKYTSLFNKKSLILGASFIIPSLSFLIYNYKLFGFITPTTSRLKANFDFLYSLKYFFSHSFFSFSSLTIIISLIMLYLIFKKDYSKLMQPIILSTLISFIYAFSVSDIFPGYRMLWGQSIVLSIFSVNLLNIKKEMQFIQISKYYKFCTYLLTSLTLIGVLSLPNTFYHKIVKQRQYIPLDNIGNMYAYANWINENLNPLDGPLGWFYLGMSYHFPEFEVVDFLGKADENIAKLKPLNANPGHNKYDFEYSLSKLKPQAFLFPFGNLSASNENLYKKDLNQILDNQDNYLSLSILNNSARENYSICQRVIEDRYKVSWGIVIMNEILKKGNFEDLRCARLDSLKINK